MNNYKVDAVLMGFLITAVVACEKKEDSFAVAGFDTDDYCELEAFYIGRSTYTKPSCICCESL
jgi:hypothetical protein